MTTFTARGLIFISISFFFCACALNKPQINYKNPKKIALLFGQALLKQDIEQAKLLSTVATKEMLNLLQTLADVWQDPTSIQPKRGVEAAAALKKARCSVVDNKAMCTLCCTDKQAATLQLTLLKIEDKWLVNISKESLRPRE
jgi:hypothetical protein